MLAGLFKAPTRYAPHINLPAARARANIVLDNLVEAGFMTEGQVFGARRNPAVAVDRRDENSPNYYLDWAFDEMRRLVNTLPKSYTERVFVVRTAIDKLDSVYIGPLVEQGAVGYKAGKKRRESRKLPAPS